jgi:oxygen-independent coproporphyrinogen-3 oxidase
MADKAFSAAGLEWYEVSNWASSVAQRCAHNLLYWQGADWGGVGPGAHSHVGGTRWWNVKHPAAYTSRLSDGRSPAYAREVLTDEERRFERVLLGTRLVDGHPLDDVHAAGRVAAADLVGRGLLDGSALVSGRLVLTLQGRLLADAVVRDLLD